MCGDQILELMSHTEKNPGRIFVKCKKNGRNIPEKCGFFMWKDRYEELINSGKQGDGTATATDGLIKESRMAKLELAVDRNMAKLIKLIKILVVTNVIILCIIFQLNFVPSVVLLVAVLLFLYFL